MGLYQRHHHHCLYRYQETSHLCHLLEYLRQIEQRYDQKYRQYVLHFLP